MRHAEDGCLTLAKKEVYCNNTERVALQRRLPEDDAWCSGAPIPTRKTGAAPKAVVFCIPGPRSKRVFSEVCTSQSLPAHVFAFRLQRDLLRRSSWRRPGQMLCRYAWGNGVFLHRRLVSGTSDGRCGKNDPTGKYCGKPERWYYLEAEESGLQHWPFARVKIS